MNKFCRRISRQNKNACASRKRSSSTERRNFGSLQRRRRPASVNGGVWNAARAVVAASGPRHTVAGLGEDGQLLSGTSGVMGRNEPITLLCLTSGQLFDYILVLSLGLDRAVVRARKIAPRAGIVGERGIGTLTMEAEGNS
jgi:hypothetical protein